MGPRLRAALVVFAAWFVLLLVTATVNGRPFFPSKMDASVFLLIQTLIATLLALCAYVVAGLILLMKGLGK